LTLRGESDDPIRTYNRYDDPRNILDFVGSADNRVPISEVTRVCPPFHG